MRTPIVLIPMVLLVLSCGSMRQGTGVSGATDSSALRTREVGVVDAPQGKAEEKKPEKPASETAKPAPSASQDQPETLGDQVVAYARTFLGTPYKLGASGPRLFDCSGFTRYVYKHFGYEMTQFTGAQFQEGREVASFADLQKGDLVFFGQRGACGISATWALWCRWTRNGGVSASSMPPLRAALSKANPRRAII